MVMAKTLTAQSILKLKPGKSRREIADGGCKSLYLHVQPSGFKSWVMLITAPTPGKLLLGEFKPDPPSKKKPSPKADDTAPPDDPKPDDPKPEPPKIGKPLTLADARWLVAQLKQEQRNGKDLIAASRDKKKSDKAKASEQSTKFAAMARQFIDEHAKPKTRRWRETAHHLGWDYNIKDADAPPTKIKDGLAERWQDREITSITRKNIFDIVDEAKRRGIPGLKRRNAKASDSRGRSMARTLSRFFKWCLMDVRKIEINPCAEMYCPGAPDKRDTVLTESGIIWFWQACSQLKAPFGDAFKLLLLTGQRLREITEMRHTELSEDNIFLTLPGSRTKNKREHEIPLAPLARTILNNVQPVSKVYVFSANGHSPIAGFSDIKKKLDQLMREAAAKEGKDFEPAKNGKGFTSSWRLHDLRRTAATRMGDSPPKGLGILPHIIEAALNHVSGTKSGVAGNYNWSLYRPEVKLAFERWALWIEGLVAGKPVKARGVALVA
jgi:integrase